MYDKHAKKKIETLKKSTPLSLRGVRKLAEEYFSVFIRQRDNGVCCTCGRKGHWKSMQVGHFVRTGNLSLKFNEINANCQCTNCNVYLNGNIKSYMIFLEKKFGEKIIDELEYLARIKTKLTKADYLDLINKYDQN